MNSPQDEAWLVCETIAHPTANVPLIAFTSWLNQSELATARGVDVLMEKPLDMPLLLKNVQALLQKSKTPSPVPA
jgi:hypothetical protein